MQQAAIPGNEKLADVNHLPIPEVPAVHHAYREGRGLRAEQGAAPTNNKDWRDATVSPNWYRDRQARERCDYYIAKALDQAARGDAVESCRLFGLVRELCQTQDLSDEGKLLIELELSAAEGYLDYCCGDFDLARTRLMESMRAGQELEDRFHHHGIHFHRIHLINNMAKLEGRAGHLDRAMNLIATTILYVQRKPVEVPFPGTWGPELVARLFLGGLQFLTTQAAIETATLFIPLEPARLLHALRILTSRVDIHECHETWRPETLEWLQLKALSLGKEPRQYLRRCISYFAAGPRHSPLLWQLTAVDAAHLCRRIDPVSATAFSNDVLADIGALKPLRRHMEVLMARLQG